MNAHVRLSQSLEFPDKVLIQRSKGIYSGSDHSMTGRLRAPKGSISFPLVGREQICRGVMLTDNLPHCSECKHFLLCAKRRLVSSRASTAQTESLVLLALTRFLTSQSGPVSRKRPAVDHISRASMRASIFFEWSPRARRLLHLGCTRPCRTLLDRRYEVRTRCNGALLLHVLYRLRHLCLRMT